MFTLKLIIKMVKIRLLTLSLIGIIAAIAYYLVTQVISKSQQKMVAQATVTHVPDFISQQQYFKPNTPSVFIAFHPECEHCQYEAKSLNERQHELEKAQIVMFTSEKDSLTKVFSHSYGLDTVQNIKVISDEKNELYTAFGVKTIPSIFIYNKAGKLVKQYKGETKIDAIIKALND